MVIMNKEQEISDKKNCQEGLILVSFIGKTSPEDIRKIIFSIGKPIFQVENQNHNLYFFNVSGNPEESFPAQSREPYDPLLDFMG